MFNLLKSIAQLIVSIVQFVIDGIKSVIMLIVMIPQYVSYLATMISILPAWIIVFLGGIVAITVIWTIRKAI